jgi:hypothetical protein
MTSGIGILPVQRSGQPFVRAGPADGFACAEIDGMRAATEGIKARPGAGQGVLEALEADEIELFRKAQHEANDGINIAVLVVMDPEGAAFRRILAHEVEASELRVVGVLISFAQFLEQRERASGLVGGADVEQA